MHLSRDGKIVRTDIWREGEYVDLWSVPHFLSGMAVAFSLYFLGFGADSAFVIAFLLLVIYEMFESVAQIEETTWNRILDVVVGMMSFTPTFLLVPRMETMHAAALFAGIVILDGILSFFGWRASQKAAELEKRMRAQLLRRRQSLAARRIAFMHWRNRKPEV